MFELNLWSKGNNLQVADIEKGGGGGGCGARLKKVAKEGDPWLGHG
jgi:hypothetical protein